MAFMEDYRFEADFLIKDTIRRLDVQQAQMLEYIRKHNWAFHEEEMTSEERIACLRTSLFSLDIPKKNSITRLINFKIIRYFVGSIRDINSSFRIR